MQIFFVMSGFLITGLLWDSREQQNRFKDFYARRVLRIMPVYYAMWLVIILLTPILHWLWTWQWSLYLLHLGNYDRFLFLHIRDIVWLDTLRTMRHGKPTAAVFLGHLWSLCIEEQFYLIWPAIVYTFRSRERLRNLCIAIVVLVPMLRWFLDAVLPLDLLKAEILYRSLPTQMDALVWGGLIAMLVRGPEAAWIKRNNGRLILLSLALVALYICFYHHLFAWGLPGTNQTYVVTFGFLVFDLLGVGLLLRSIHPGSEVSRFFSLRWIARFGTITYGFYLFHDPPHLLYFAICRRIVPYAFASTATAVLAFLSTTLLASASFRWLEQPIMKLKKRFTHQVHTVELA